MIKLQTWLEPRSRDQAFISTYFISKVRSLKASRYSCNFEALYQPKSLKYFRTFVLSEAFQKGAFPRDARSSTAYL
jgi:hypothetical protein